MRESLKLIGLPLIFILLGVSPGQAGMNKLLATDPQPSGAFGLALAADGGEVAVGMNLGVPFMSTGAVEFFERDDAGGWVSRGYFAAPNPSMNSGFGWEIVLEGGNAFVAAPGADESRGEVYWMTRDTRSADPWSHRLLITAPNAQPYDNFGRTLALQGDRLVVGAPRVNGPGDLILCGAVFVYGRTGEAWNLEQTLQPAGDCIPQGLDFGHSLALDGDRLAIGSQLGLHIYDRISGVWQETARLKPAPDATNSYAQFGRRVALDGDRLLISSPVFGSFPGRSAYIYERVAGVWTRAAELIVSDPGEIQGLGTALALHGNLALLGCPTGPIHATYDPGVVYAFERQSSGVWLEVRRILGPSGPDTYFGNALDFDGDRAWIGAQTDNDGVSWGTGAAYLVDVAPLVFADGFESGSVAAWSVALP